MAKIQVEVNTNANVDSIRKLISFAAQEITGFSIEDGYFVLEVEDGCDIAKVEEKARKLIKRFVKENSDIQEKVVYANKVERAYIKKDDIYGSSLVNNYGNGLISLRKEAIKLYQYFDNAFRSFAHDLGAEDKSYPVLLPIDAYQKTGYLKTSPQYAMFCSAPREDIDYLENINKCACGDTLSECVNQPKTALSPAACFHSYMELENEILDKPFTITFNQSVFRNEGRFNWSDFGRLADYHVREIVFFGDYEYVRSQRMKMLEKTKQLVEQLKLDAQVCVTFDPFVVPTMQKFKKFQIQEESKYEMQLSYGDNSHLAASSFNIHGTSFTDAFNISLKDIEKPITGCVGYGIERWVLAFISQYGLQPEKWPKEILS